MTFPTTLFAARPRRAALKTCRRALSAVIWTAATFALLSLVRAADSSSFVSSLTIDFNSPVNPELQARLLAIDTALRTKHDMAEDDTAIGLLDLRTRGTNYLEELVAVVDDELT